MVKKLAPNVGYGCVDYGFAIAICHMGFVD